MSRDQDLGNAITASERFFRLYHSHCTAPNEDTLFSLLEACHSLNDRLNKTSEIDLHQIPEFLALKAMRNYFHHEAEMLHRVSLIPNGSYPVVSDLLSMCLVPKDIVESAIKGVPARYQKGTRADCEQVFHWYGELVNINPAIFNCAVKVFEALIESGLPVSGDAWDAFRSSYMYEEQAGLSHYVDGRITTSAGAVETVLQEIAQKAAVISLPPKT